MKWKFNFSLLFSSSNTYDEIETASNKIWRYQRYGLVFDYYYKPLLVPPLSIVYYAFLLVKFIFKSIKDLIVKKKVEKDNLKSFLKDPIFGRSKFCLIA